jgi:hypothetical protein
VPVLVTATKTKFFMDGNQYLFRSGKVEEDDWSMIGGYIKLWEGWKGPRVTNEQLREEARRTIPGPFPEVTTQPAEQAYELVLKNVGALPRDSYDEQLISEVRSGTGHIPQRSNPAWVDPGYPELKSTDPPADTDSDGMPDAWETKYGLDPADPADGPDDLDEDGFTNVEEYRNGTDPKEKFPWVSPPELVVKSDAENPERFPGTAYQFHETSMVTMLALEGAEIR